MQHVFAANVCFKADGYSEQSFVAPAPGEIIGIKLKHTGGSVSCVAGSGQAKWGCGGNTMIYISMIEKETKETWYPTAGTDGVSGLEPLDNGCVVDASYGCSVQRYNMAGYDGVNSKNIIWFDGDGIRQVTESNEWSIQVLNPPSVVCLIAISCCFK